MEHKGISASLVMKEIIGNYLALLSYVRYIFGYKKCYTEPKI